MARPDARGHGDARVTPARATRRRTVASASEGWDRAQVRQPTCARPAQQQRAGVPPQLRWRGGPPPEDARFSLSGYGPPASGRCQVRLRTARSASSRRCSGRLAHPYRYSRPPGAPAFHHIAHGSTESCEVPKRTGGSAARASRQSPARDARTRARSGQVAVGNHWSAQAARHGQALG